MSSPAEKVSRELIPITPERCPAILGTSGVYGVGKDYVLVALAYRRLGFADPLYAIAESHLGSHDKKVFGVRQFLQAVGQWGRGVITPEYPLSLERANFTRSLLHGQTQDDRKLRETLNQFGVLLSQWGTQDIWANALKVRIKGALATAKVLKQPQRVAVSNVRFLNEVELIHGLGGEVWYVTAPMKDITARRSSVTAGTEDVSEKLALALKKSLKDPVQPVAVEGKQLTWGEVVQGVVWNSTAELEGIHDSIPVMRL